MSTQALRSELLAMVAEDARVREELARDGALFEGYHPRMREVHERNGARLWIGAPVSARRRSGCGRRAGAVSQGRRDDTRIEIERMIVVIDGKSDETLSRM